MVRTLGRDTLLDLTVNVVPAVIMALFAALFVLYNPWGRLGLSSLVQFGLLLVLVGVLLYVSRRAGLAVSRAEENDE